MLYKAIQKTKTSHLIMMFTKNSSFSDRDQRLGLAEPLVLVIQKVAMNQFNWSKWNFVLLSAALESEQKLLRTLRRIIHNFNSKTP
jgi:hypothetical protein